MNLYKKFAKDFSSTRNSAWQGWFTLEKKYHISKARSCLDLGCGNGRFFNFLAEQGSKLEIYTGIDNSIEMLEIAKNVVLEKYNLLCKDVGNHLWYKDIIEKFELIVAFGLIHHLLNESQWCNFFQGIKNLVCSSNIICITFWQFLSDEREKKKIIQKLDLKNNFELKFSNIATRFCHFFSPEEAKQLVEQNGINIIDTFFADGRSNLLNFYIVGNYV